MQEKRRLLITGATGFIGRHLVPALAGHGHKVVAALRRPMALSPLIDQVLIKDLADGVDWMPLLQGIDADLARATARTGARLIFVSSIAAQSGPSSDAVLTENDPCLPSTAYGRSKLDAEIDIAASGAQYVILRPTLVYGRGAKGNMRKLIRLARLPLPLPFGAVANKRSLLAIENLISAIALLLDRDDIRNEVFLIADATPVSLPEIIAGLRNGMGRPANLIPIPPVLLANIFRMWQMSEDWKKLAGNLDVSVAKLNSIGYSPVIATPEGLAAMAVGNGGSGQYFREAMKARP